jgi:hypothetical protein
MRRFPKPPLVFLRIPGDADQRSGLMPITHSERYRLVIPGGFFLIQPAGEIA